MNNIVIFLVNYNNPVLYVQGQQGVDGFRGKPGAPGLPVRII